MNIDQNIMLTTMVRCWRRLPNNLRCGLVGFVTVLSFMILLNFYNIAHDHDGGRNTNSNTFVMHDGLEGEYSDTFLSGTKSKIYSGAIHYFRVIPQYWNHRLTKLKEMGLNTVET